MTWYLVLWISLAPGQWLAVEVPMPDQAACFAAVRQTTIAPRPHERVAACRERAR
jgi:trans-aconitate methyltransferase